MSSAAAAAAVHVADADLPQFVAAISGDTQAVAAFLQAGGTAQSVDKWSETMLHKAALNNQLAVLELLLAAGGNVNQHNECLQTALHYACISGGAAAVRCLLEKGADVNARDKFQQAPLHCACIYGHVEVSIPPSSDRCFGAIVYEETALCSVSCASFGCPVEAC
jgi:ankyrin repeat protein